METTFDWLQRNASVLSTLVTMATLLVWLVWLQLMYSDYRRRRHPRMLIHQTHGVGPDSHCLLVNLSQGIIHIQCVRVAAVGENGESSLPLGAALSPESELGGLELENVIRQGPLAQGQFLRLGSFEEILESLVGQSPAEGEKWLGSAVADGLKLLEIRVAAVYGDSDRSVGARRTFRLESRDGALCVRPRDTYTKQLYSRRERRIAEGWLRRCLDE